MRFIQLNMKKAFVAAVELAKYLEGKENFTCLITEPYRHKEKIAMVPTGVNQICSSRNARAAIFYKGTLDLLGIESLTIEDCAVGLLKTQSQKNLIASVYLDINNDTIPSWLDKIMKYARQKRYPVLIGMDSNAHSSSVSYTHLTLPTIYSV